MQILVNTQLDILNGSYCTRLPCISTATITAAFFDFRHLHYYYYYYYYRTPSNLTDTRKIIIMVIVRNN